jgi:hypothetical protein
MTTAKAGAKIQAPRTIKPPQREPAAQVEDEEEVDPWETESGLPNDVDAYMANCRFGFRDEYQQQIVAGGGEEGTGLMFLCDLVSESGETFGNQGWSIGTGWVTEDDGATIVHPTRRNVVTSSRYGQLQNRVVKELEVSMRDYGLPTIAATWNGLGFHWMLEEHETLKEVDGVKQKKPGLMPTLFIGVSEDIRGGKVAPAQAPERGPIVSTELETKLMKLAQENDYRTFVTMAVREPGVASNDDLMAQVMDDGPEGFFQAHQR